MNVDCRLPTGSSYGPPMQSRPASSLVQCCEEKSRGCGCCTAESTPSGVALIATTKDPLASDPSCTAITVPKTSHHDLYEGGVGWLEGGRRVAALPGLAFLTSMRALAPRHTPARLCILRLVLLVLSRAGLPAQMLAHPHGPWRTRPPSRVSTPQFGHASVPCLCGILG